MRNVTFRKDRVNLEALDKRLRSVFGEGVIGLSYDGTDVTVHLEDETPDAPIASEIDAHDPDVETEGQTRERLMDLARTELLTSDFKTLRDAINNASTLAALRPILRGMLLVMWRMALAQGLTHETDVGNT